MVITRFAPSPTGDPHIGNFRTALFNWILARKEGGRFILRIEDTDQKRFVKESEQWMRDGLDFLGIDYDEEYRQSDRLDVYNKYTQELIAGGHAYHCFCTPERLDTLRETQRAAKRAPKYDRHCCSLSPEEVQHKLDAREPSVVRFKIPENETLTFTDLVRGEISFETKDVDDFVLMKSDGYPTYQLASVLDDHLMNISHIIRGEEWISSTPKHLLIYHALGVDAPQYAHLPLILAKDKSKLSKRTGDVSLRSYIDKGYLPEALINYVMLLGWNPGDDREFFTIEDLIKNFQIENINKSGSIFDIEKLNWFNGHYIREMNLKSLTIRCLPYLENAHLLKTEGDEIRNPKTGKVYTMEELQRIIATEQERMKRLGEIAELVDFYFVDELDFDIDLFLWKKLTYNDVKEALEFSQSFLSNATQWDAETLEKSMIHAIADAGKKNGEVLWPLRVALCGKQKSPSPFEIAAALGRETTLKRIEHALSRIPS